MTGAWIGWVDALVFGVCFICAAVLVYALIVLAVLWESKRSTRRSACSRGLKTVAGWRHDVGCPTFGAWTLYPPTPPSEGTPFPREQVRNVESTIDWPLNP